MMGHFGIAGWRRTLPRAFAIEALERCFFPAAQRPNDVTHWRPGFCSQRQDPVLICLRSWSCLLHNRNWPAHATRENRPRNRLLVLQQPPATPAAILPQAESLHLAISDLVLAAWLG